MLIPSEDKVLELFKGHFTWKVTLRATNLFYRLLGLRFSVYWFHRFPREYDGFLND